MSEHNARGDLIVALRDEIARLHADASGKELVITRLTSALAAAREVLEECASEIEGWVKNHYAGTQEKYPGEKLRYDRDMGPADRARVLIATISAYDCAP